MSTRVEIATLTIPSITKCQISLRTLLDCEVLETYEDDTLLVKILQAGAGLSVDDEITIPASKVTEE